MEHVSKDCSCSGKYCKTCEETQCVGQFYQYYGICKNCVRKRSKRYHQVNAEAIRENHKRYYQENADSIKARVKRYRENNPEIIKQRKAKYRENNLEKIRQGDKRHYQQNRKQRLEYNRQWRTGHTEYIKTQSKMYRDAHLELIKERGRRYSQQNKERIAQYHRQYYQQNKMLWSYTRPEIRERSRVHGHTRRARQKAVAGTHTAQQIRDQLRRQKYRCYYAACGHAKFKKEDNKYAYEIEHTFPLSRVAGTDIPANDMSYLVLSCSECNSKKRNKFPWEWPEGGRLL